MNKQEIEKKYIDRLEEFSSDAIILVSRFSRDKAEIAKEYNEIVNADKPLDDTKEKKVKKT